MVLLLARAAVCPEAKIACGNTNICADFEISADFAREGAECLAQAVQLACSPLFLNTAALLSRAIVVNNN